MAKKLKTLQGFDPDSEKSSNIQEILVQQGFRVDPPADTYNLSKIFSLSAADNKNSALKFTFEFTVPANRDFAAKTELGFEFYGFEGFDGKEFKFNQNSKDCCKFCQKIFDGFHTLTDEKFKVFAYQKNEQNFTEKKPWTNWVNFAVIQFLFEVLLPTGRELFMSEFLGFFGKVMVDKRGDTREKSGI
jgi:hypothetical protein